jgi:hypothetical protein
MKTLNSFIVLLVAVALFACNNSVSYNPDYKYINVTEADFNAQTPEEQEKTVAAFIDFEKKAKEAGVSLVQFARNQQLEPEQTTPTADSAATTTEETTNEPAKKVAKETTTPEEDPYANLNDDASNDLNKINAEYEAKLKKLKEIENRSEAQDKEIEELEAKLKSK